MKEKIDCSFYNNRLEKKYNCGPDGYPMRYGDKICNRFSTTYNEFSPSGQAWIDKTRKCLTTSLIPLFSDSKYDCKSLEKYAFDTHDDCYVNTGFCDLIYNFSNPKELAYFLRGLWLTFDAKDFFTLSAVNNVWKTMFRCAVRSNVTTKENQVLVNDEVHMEIDTKNKTSRQ
jgi:hypothetical protein